jgi:hypothetical protein
MPSKRTLIEPHKGDKRYIRRNAKGRIRESDDVARSLAVDRRSQAKTLAKPGQGDEDDRARKVIAYRPCRRAVAARDPPG